MASKTDEEQKKVLIDEKIIPILVSFSASREEASWIFERGVAMLASPPPTISTPLSLHSSRAFNCSVIEKTDRAQSYKIVSMFTYFPSK